MDPTPKRKTFKVRLSLGVKLDSEVSHLNLVLSQDGGQRRTRSSRPSGSAKTDH